MKPLLLFVCTLGLVLLKQCPSKQMPPVLLSGEYDCESHTLEITFAKSATTGSKFATVDDAKDLFIRSGVTAFAFEEFKSHLTAKCGTQGTDMHNDLTEQFKFIRIQDIEGRLSFAGSQPVLLNGQPSITGASIKSGVLIEIPSAVWASVDLGKLGSIEPAPDTKLKLEFDEARISVWLSRGCATLRTHRGVSGEIYSDKYAPQRSSPQSPGLLKACIAGVSPSTALPSGQSLARLTTRNNQLITLNGDSATTGASIFSGAILETAADQSATVNLETLGKLDIGPDTKLVLTFDTSYVKAVIIVGCAVLTTKAKTVGEIATEPHGTAGRTDPRTGGVLEVCHPLGAAAPTLGPGIPAAGATSAGGDSGGLFALPSWLRGPVSKQEVYPVLLFLDGRHIKFNFFDKVKMNTKKPEEAIRSRGGPSCMRQTSNLRLTCFDGTEIHLIPPKRKK